MSAYNNESYKLVEANNKAERTAKNTDIKNCDNGKVLPAEIDLNETITIELPRYIKWTTTYVHLEKRATIYFDLKGMKADKFTKLVGDMCNRSVGIAYRFIFGEKPDSETVVGNKLELQANIFDGEQFAVFTEDFFSGKQRGPSKGGKSVVSQVDELSSEDEINKVIEAAKARLKAMKQIGRS